MSVKVSLFAQKLFLIILERAEKVLHVGDSPVERKIIADDAGASINQLTSQYQT